MREENIDSVELDRLYRIEYLSFNLLQKLRNMRYHVDSFVAQASGLDLEYGGPTCEFEVSELEEAFGMDDHL